MLMKETIDKYIEHTMISGEEHIREEIEWLIEGLNAPEETEQWIKDVVEGIE